MYYSSWSLSAGLKSEGVRVLFLFSEFPSAELVGLGLAAPHVLWEPRDTLWPPAPASCVTTACAASHYLCDPAALGGTVLCAPVAGPLRPGLSRKEAGWRLTTDTALSPSRRRALGRGDTFVYPNRRGLS